MSIQTTRRRAGWLGLVLALAGGIPAQSEAGIINLGTANSFNVFSLGDDTQSGTDAQGRVAVGGNAYFGGSGYTIASNRPSGSTVNLVVGGNYSNTYNTVNGSAVIGGNATINGPTINGNLAVNGNLALTGYGTVSGNVTYGTAYSNPNTTLGSPPKQGTTTLPVDFASERSYLTNLSNALASAATTGSIAFNYGQFTLTGSNTSSNVFNIKGSDLASANGFTINAPSGSTVVINVDGTVDRMQNFGFTYNGGLDQQHVLFNFNTATQLSLGGISVLGSILAPNAAVNFVGGNINGTLAVGSITGGGESHDFLFQGDLSSVVGPSFQPNIQPSPVPEPASLAMVLVGLGFTGALARRQRAG